jgi:hypothetical protein
LGRFGLLKIFSLRSPTLRSSYPLLRSAPLHSSQSFEDETLFVPGSLLLPLRQPPSFQFFHERMCLTCGLHCQVCSWDSATFSVPLSRRASRSLATLAISAFVFVLVLDGFLSARRIASDFYGVSNLPHFTGAVNELRFETDTRSQAQTLIAEVGGGQLFFLTPKASFYYLVTDLRNPTPYDYPISFVFGAQGQQEVIGALKEGRIDFVCLFYENWPHSLQARRIVRFVESQMYRQSDLGACRMYSRIL